MCVCDDPPRSLHPPLRLRHPTYAFVITIWVWHKSTERSLWRIYTPLLLRESPRYVYSYLPFHSIPFVEIQPFFPHALN